MASSTTEATGASLDRGREQSSESSGHVRWKRDAIVAAACGLAIATTLGLATFLIGSVGGTEARALLEAILPTSRFLLSAVMTATATILALMLTLLSLGVSAEAELKETHYRRVQQIAFYAMLLFVLSTGLLVVHCIPIQKSKEIPNWWYPTVYYSLLGSAAVVGGALVSLVVMLYTAIRDAIQVICIEPATKNA